MNQTTRAVTVLRPAFRPSLIALAAATLCAAAAHAAPVEETPATPAAAAVAGDTAPAIQDTTPAGAIATVEISTRKTRSSVAMSGVEIQKVLPGMNPLKAIQSLPGVSFQTADPWGNNEQNLSLFVHGFNAQQMGFTMDGVPLGDQSYGNYNGLAPQRALTSENVRSVVLATGAGDLGTPATNNLGGTIETYSIDPSKTRNVNLQQTVGSYKATRTFIRFDSGDIGGGNRFFISGLHHEARAWDFDGRQSNDQVNAKFVHEGAAGKLTLFADWSDKIEPNEDSVLHKAGTPAVYTRTFMYPDFAAALAYLGSAAAINAKENFRNYYSDAQRTDKLAYARYEAYLSDNATWSNQYYFHHNDGVGVVAGPIDQAGLPGLFRVYFPNQDLKTVFGGSGYATRTTEYKINRQGWLSNLDWELGAHRIQAGLWFEHNNSGAYRRWYALDVNNPSDPYTRPSNPLITQYGSDIDNKVVQLHLQDEWRLRPDFVLQGGFKSSLQFAEGLFPVNTLPKAISPTATGGLPEGKIDTKKWFLPGVGARWDLSKSNQLFANVQKNLRQYMTYGGGGNSPWSLSSQATFDYFKATAKPETSVTYELGLRDSRNLDLGPLTGFDGQVALYHVLFRDRQLAISSNPNFTSFVGGTTILSNVGSVKTGGVDLAGTFHFGRAFSFYDAVSYNRSKYQDNYEAGTATGTTTVLTGGKIVPNTPEWMNKFIASWKPGNDIELQVSGDYIGKRYVTYTNDLDIPGYFLMGLSVSGKVPLAGSFLKNLRWSVSSTNLLSRKGMLQPVVGQNSGSYASYPIPPRMAFVTLKADI